MNWRACLSFLILAVLPVALYPPFRSLSIYRPMSLFNANGTVVAMNEFGAIGTPWQGEPLTGLTMGGCNLTNAPINANWKDIFSRRLGAPVHLSGYSLMGNDVHSEIKILQKIQQKFDFAVIEVTSTAPSLSAISAFRATSEAFSLYYPPAWGEFGAKFIRNYIYKDKFICSFPAFCKGNPWPPLYSQMYFAMDKVYETSSPTSLKSPYELLIEEAKRISSRVVFLFVSMPNDGPKMPLQQHAWLETEASKAGIEFVHFHYDGAADGPLNHLLGQQTLLAERIAEKLSRSRDLANSTN